MKKPFILPALLLGLTLAGTGTYAFASSTSGQLPTAVLSNFTADQQAAITKAEQIRSAADVQAGAVLKAAGVTENQFRKAMASYHDMKRKALDAALTNNDYAAYTALIANSPHASTMTTDIFAKLVKMHALEASGDKTGAMAIRKELKAAGFKGMGIYGKGGHDRGSRSSDVKTITPAATTTITSVTPAS